MLVLSVMRWASYPLFDFDFVTSIIKNVQPSEKDQRFKVPYFSIFFALYTVLTS